MNKCHGRNETKLVRTITKFEDEMKVHTQYRVQVDQSPCGA